MSTGQTSPRKALLLLKPERTASFSASAATEGAHETLGAPTGAALLGWAAAEGRYGAFSESSTIFHSGRVRFSNALPLSRDGEIGFPLPQILMKPKHGASGWKGSAPAKLDATTVTIGRPGGDEAQRDAVKGGFITASGVLVKIETGGRTRTAMERGAPKPTALFGLSHVEPASGLAYAATIEADAGALDEAAWTQLLDAFDGKTLRLGRAAASAHGGAYACKVSAAPEDGLWPEADAGIASETVMVWALSDLALIDPINGMPRAMPEAADFGIDATFGLDAGSSVVSQRRYAPWNGHLDARDVERQVIAAGSVFVFQRKGEEVSSHADAPVALRSIVGIHREAGLGRVWLQPPLLRAGIGGKPDLSHRRPRIAERPAGATPPECSAMGDSSRHTVEWLKGRSAGGNAA